MKQDAARGELQKTGQHRRQPRCAGHHRVGDAGEHGDQRWNMGGRVDQGLELAEYLAAGHLDRTHLGDLVVDTATGGLQIDHDEGQLAQRGPE